MNSIEQDSINSVGSKWHTVFRGYFSSEKVLQSFWSKIQKYISQEKRDLHVADFGGGTGNLGEYVCAKLRVLGLSPKLTIVDLQEESLKANTNPTTEKVVGDIRTILLPHKQDIILMRSVLSYIPYEEQNAALLNILNHMNDSAHFFHQFAGYQEYEEAILVKQLHKDALDRSTYLHTVDEYHSQIQSIRNVEGRSLSTTLLGFTETCIVDTEDYCKRFFPQDATKAEHVREVMFRLAKQHSTSKKVYVVDELQKKVEVHIDFPVVMHRLA